MDPDRTTHRPTNDGLDGFNEASTVTVHVPDESGDPTKIDPRRSGHEGPPCEGEPIGFGERYASVTFHARGGIGRVWKARDGLLGRDVALKEIRPELAGDPAVERRFREEARITAGLEHPNIITLHDLSTDPNRPFYTMRFLDGRTLKEAVHAHYGRKANAPPAPLDFRGLLDAFLDVCHALAFAHSRGVIHRDLKGGNIMVGPFGEVAVLDWGLAREIGAVDDPLARPTIALADLPGDMSRTMAGSPIGTAQYMPPEQAAGRADVIGVCSDVFGLGAILYLILTGRPPYDGPSQTETIRKALNHEFPRPSAMKSSIPPALEAICLKAMAKKPEDRYESAPALADDVRRWLADEPVAAYPDGLSGTAMRWARKHQPAMAGIAALLATATVALAASTWVISAERDKVVTAEIKSHRSFDVVRDVMPRFLDQMAEPGLASVPEARVLRANLVRDAVILAPRLTNIDPNDPDLRRLEALIDRRAAALERLDDHVGPAADLLARAVALTRGLAADSPADTLWLAEALKDQAALEVALGRFANAEAEYREAAKLVETPADGAPRTPAFRRVSSWVAVQLSYVLRETGRPREALAAADEALKAITPAGTPPLEDLRDLAEAHLARGRALADLGSRPEALAELNKAVRFARTRWELAGDQPDPRYELATAMLTRARFHLADPASRDPAAADFGESITHLILLRDRYWHVLYYRSELAWARALQGGLLVDLGKLDEAETASAEAHEVAKMLAGRNLGLVGDEQTLARTLYLRGRIARVRGKVEESRTCFQDAIARYDRVLALNPGSPDDLAFKAEVQAEMDRSATK
jgi:eukaryotic-like serine/threonine-protein kinase